MLMKTKTLFIAGLCMAASVANAQTEAKTYDFTKFTQEQIAEFEEAVSDGTWKNDANIYKSAEKIGKNKKPVDCTNIAKLGGGPLVNKSKKEFSFTKGLLFAVYVDKDKACKSIYPKKDTGIGNIWFNVDNKQAFKNALQLNANNIAIIIPNLTKGMKVSVRYRSTTSKQNRYLSGFNFEQGHSFVAPTGTEPGKTDHTGEGTVAQDGAAWVTSTGGGVFIYDITIKDKDGNVIPTAINNPQTQTAQDNKVYDLNGHYMGNNINALQHGMYILNGKKIIK